MNDLFCFVCFMTYRKEKLK